MKKMTSQQIRETWLNFFKERGHMVEPGASLIPQNDPTLLWINAGVAALKKYCRTNSINGVEILAMPSTSPANARCNFEKLKNIWAPALLN